MWEWRAFFPRAGESAFARLLPDDGDWTEVRADAYVVADGIGPGRGLKLRAAETLELKLLVARDGELERWQKPFIAGLPVPPHRTRELARALAPAAPVPVRPLRSLDDVLRLVRDLRLGEPRLVTVSKRVRAALHDGARVERSLVLADGRALETVAVEAPDPDVVRRVVARLGAAPPGATVASFPALLAGAP